MAPDEEVDIDRLEATAQQIEAELCVESLRDFTERAWRHADPKNELIDSVALDAFIAAGTAVAEGRIRRLGVETCPGTAKSLFWSVIYPAWLLLRSSGRERVMSGAYAWKLGERDASRCRLVVQSPWYQGLVAALTKNDEEPWTFREDQNAKGDWWTSATGRRITVSVDGKTTGERCSIQVIDDPLSGQGAKSAAEKRAAIEWCFELMASRLEDQRTDARVMVMQPLAPGDPLDEARSRGWTILTLPAVLGMWGVPEEGCVLLDDDGVEVWRDPRKPGEPISALLDLPTLERMRSPDELGPAVFATQYLMLRSNDGAATFKRTYWRWYYQRSGDAMAARPAHTDTTHPSLPMPAHFGRIAITADLKFLASVGDYASVQAWGESGPDLYLLKARRGRVGYENSVEWIEDFAKLFPGASIGIEKAANGYAVIETLKKKLRGVKGLKPWGKKKQRHAAAVPTAKDGHCYLPLGAVFEEVDEDGTVTMVDATEFVEEHAGATKFDDQMDASSYAILELVGVGTRRPSAPQGGTRGTADTTVAAVPSVPRSASAPPSIWAAIGGSRGSR